MRQVVEVYGGASWPQGREAADVLQHALDAGLVRDAIQVSMELLWTGVFTGSILSIVVSLIVQARRVVPRRN